MLERSYRRREGIKYSKKCCQTTCLLIITGMNLIGIFVLIILFACHKAQEFRRIPPTFTSTLSFEPQFPSTHFTHLTSDSTQQFLRTAFFQDRRLPQAIWIFSDNLRTAPCCELETALTPTYEEFSNSESSFPPPESITLEILPSEGSYYPMLTISIPESTFPTTTMETEDDDEMNEYFYGWQITSPPPKKSEKSGIFLEKLQVKKLISNQVVGPPSIKPTTEDVEMDNGFLKSNFGPPSTAPDEATLKTLNQGDQSSQVVSDYFENTVTAAADKNDNKIMNFTAAVISKQKFEETTINPSTKIENVLKTTPNSGTTAIYLDCSKEKNQHSTHNCQQWKKAGYCRGHSATKYIFCRFQCLCDNIMPEEEEEEKEK